MSSLIGIGVAVLLGGLQAPTQDCAGRAQAFRAALEALRAGDDGAREDLTAAGRALCSECDRCDATGVADYYLALDDGERLLGLQADARFGELYAAVQAAGRAGLAGDAWSRERERILGELRALAEAVASQADYVPAARAWSLAARLEVEQLEGAGDLGAERAGRLAESAERDATRALELFARSGLVTPRLEPLWLRARLELGRRRFTAAREGFEEVGRLATLVGDLDYREHGLRGLVRLARASGDALAEDRLLARLATFRDPRASWPLARDWAGRLIAEEHAAEALDFLERCAPHEDAHARDRAEWDLCMGAALLRLGELELAREHLERAAERAPSELAVLALAQLALLEGRGFEVRALLEDAPFAADFSESARAEALRILGEERLLAGDSAGALPELTASLATAAAWRRSLAAGLAGDPRAARSGYESVLGEWAGLHTLALAAEALRLEGRPLEALRLIAEGHSPSLREARAGAASLRAVAAGHDPAHVSQDDLAGWIDAGELGLVAWVLGADFGVVVTAWRQDGELVARAARVERGRAQVSEAARRLREAAVAGDPARLAREGLAVRAALLPESVWAPLVERARALGPDARLLALVHGPLERLPLELLPGDGAGELCDDLFVLAALPGLLDARPPAPGPQAQPLDWSLLGAPTPSADLPALPGAARELEHVAELRPAARLVLGPAFTRERLGQALAAGRALHVATHLSVDGHGELALVTSGGGRLSTRDVQASALPLPLVVLTACDTGGGAFVDGQGLHGIARAFLETGSAALVVTSWPVADAAAELFGVHLHRALLAGSSPARATRRARAALREAGWTPREWAAFRLLGAH